VEKSANIRRKTFVAREDLLNRVAKVAEKQGCSLFELVNDLFQLVLVSDELNFSLKCVVDECRVLEVAKRSGHVLGSERLLYEMVELAYKQDEAGLLKAWFDSGVLFASNYFTVGDQFLFEEFKTDLLAFTWNAPEFIIESSGNKLFVKVTSPRFTEVYTFLFASFLMGALESFGYKLGKKEVSKGIIRLETVRSVT